MHYMAAPELHFERLILQGLESHLQGAESSGPSLDGLVVHSGML